MIHKLSRLADSLLTQTSESSAVWVHQFLNVFLRRVADGVGRELKPLRNQFVGDHFSKAIVGKALSSRT